MTDRTARPISCFGWAARLSLAALLASLLVAASGNGSELRQTPIVKAVKRVEASVVNIRGEKTLGANDPQSAPTEPGRRVNGMGTGVVIDSRGYVVTNHHVVAGVRQIQVTMADGRQFTAKLVARDLETDLAVIKVDVKQKLPVIPLGTSSDLMPGETVFAVGNAYGYENTVTRGIISALHRAVEVNDAQFYDDLIQTDASINPGNSGGPLLNIDGEMIGLNVAVRAGAQGIGFAIPVDKTLATAAKLLASHCRKTAWHGTVLTDESDASDQGVTVASIDEGSPAADAGLQSGDVITGIDDLGIQRSLDFHRSMLERTAGDELELAVRRGNESKTLKLSLVSLPAALKSQTDPAWNRLGLQLKPISKKQFRENHQKSRYRGGLSVSEVRPSSPAATTGIRRGDILVGMHVWETVSLENVSYILNRPDFTSLNPMKFFILRGDETLYGYLPVGAKTAQRPKGRETERHFSKG